MGGHVEASAAGSGVCGPADRTTSVSVNAPPTRRLSTGTAKIMCAFGQWAMTTEQTGIVIAPTTNVHDATARSELEAGRVGTVSQKNKFTAPRPKKETWPRRYIRRLKLA